MVELESVDADFGEVIKDVPVVAAGVHQDVQAAVMGGGAESAEEGFEYFTPHGGADEEAFLGAPVLAEYDAVGAGVGDAVDDPFE